MIFPQIENKLKDRTIRFTVKKKKWKRTTWIILYYSKWPTIVEEVWPVQYIGVL